jgi:hypothetical protein
MWMLAGVLSYDEVDSADTDYFRFSSLLPLLCCRECNGDLTHSLSDVEFVTEAKCRLLWLELSFNIPISSLYRIKF